MSKVTFRSKQPYFQLSYMDVFKVGCGPMSRFSTS